MNERVLRGHFQPQRAIFCLFSSHANQRKNRTYSLGFRAQHIVQQTGVKTLENTLPKQLRVFFSYFLSANNKNPEEAIKRE